MNLLGVFIYVGMGFSSYVMPSLFYKLLDHNGLFTLGWLSAIFGYLMIYLSYIRVSGGNLSTFTSSLALLFLICHETEIKHIALFLN